jgi:hypothetical protein
MVNIQDFISRFTLAVLTLVSIPCKDVLSGVPKLHLFTLLILRTLYVGVVYFLSIELPHLESDMVHREKTSYHVDQLYVEINTVFHRWR